MTDAGKLKITASGDREIVMIRSFNAPSALVFDAFTKPAAQAMASGAAGLDDAYLRDRSSSWRQVSYVWRNVNNGNEMGMGGVYREVAPPERIVATEKRFLVPRWGCSHVGYYRAGRKNQP